MEKIDLTKIERELIKLNKSIADINKENQKKYANLLNYLAFQSQVQKQILISLKHIQKEEKCQHSNQSISE